jgi:hypothetical protein
MWQLKFEVHNIIGVAMTYQVKTLLDSFGLLDKVIAYVKDESSNLNILGFYIFKVSCFAL